MSLSSFIIKLLVCTSAAAVLTRSYTIKDEYLRYHQNVCIHQTYSYEIYMRILIFTIFIMLLIAYIVATIFSIPPQRRHGKDKKPHTHTHQEMTEMIIFTIINHICTFLEQKQFSPCDCSALHMFASFVCLCLFWQTISVCTR